MKGGHTHRDKAPNPDGYHEHDEHDHIIMWCLIIIALLTRGAT